MRTVKYFLKIIFSLLVLKSQEFLFNEFRVAFLNCTIGIIA